MNKNFDFNEKEISNEEVMEIINKSYAIDGTTTSILNFQRVKTVVYVYNVLKNLAKGSKTKVTVDFNGVKDGHASISISGVRMSFKNTEWFVAASKCASNFNVFSKTNGTIQIDYMFYGLLNPIE